MMECPVIFLAFANDRQDYLYKLTEEQDAIRLALAPAERAGLCQVIYETDSSLDKIWRTFNKYRGRIAIFHFGGHATDFQLLLQSAAGERQLAHGEGLTSFLARQKGLELVFINGCCSKRQAEALRDQGVPAVIGTSEPIDDTLASTLSAEFYRGLAAGRPLEFAWQQAKDRLKSEKGDAAYARGIKVSTDHPDSTKNFPWDLYIRRGSEAILEWNLPLAAQNPLFGLPLPERYYLKLPNVPYVGLQYFREDDAAVFFGRGNQIREVYNQIKGSYPIILLYGKSGVGKSSMLDAGLVPRVRDEYQVVYTRRIQEFGLTGTLNLALDEYLRDQLPERQPPQTLPLLEATDRKLLVDILGKIENPDLRERLGGLIDSLNEAEKEEPSIVSSLPNLLQKWQALERQSGKPLLIILDQVEEKFTRPRPPAEHHERGLDELIELLYAIQPLFGLEKSEIVGKLILSYRKEYHPEIRDTFRAMALPKAEVFIKRLDRHGIIEAIEGVERNLITRQKYRLELEKNQNGALPSIIADDLLSDPESPIAPVLQIILKKLWETVANREDEKVKIGIQQYRELRKQGTTMGEFFREQMETLALLQPDLRASGLALDLLHAHTTDLATAGSCRLDELLQRYAVEKQRIKELLRQLQELSLLVAIEIPGQKATDKQQLTILAHDTLAPIVIREYNLSDAPGQRATRILKHKLSELGFRVDPSYFKMTRAAGLTILTSTRELNQEFIGQDKFLAAWREALGEERFQKDKEQLLANAQLNFQPGKLRVRLDSSDLALVEEGSGLNKGSVPGMPRLTPPEERLIQESQQERALQRRQRRRLHTAGMIMIGLILSASVFAVFMMNKANINAAIAEEKRIEADSLFDLASLQRDSAKDARRQADTLRLQEKEARITAETNLNRLNLSQEQVVNMLVEQAEQQIKRLNFPEAAAILEPARALVQEHRLLGQTFMELAYVRGELYEYVEATRFFVAAAQLMGRLPTVRAAPAEQSLNRVYHDYFHNRLRSIAPNHYRLLNRKYYPEMISVRGGEFEMGCKSPRDGNCGPGEGLRTVRLHTYEIARTETTVWQYFLFAQATDDHWPETTPSWGWHGDDPMVYVSWTDAVAYANWVSKQHGVPPAYKITSQADGTLSIADWDLKPLDGQTAYRLPTEAEWEFAARGGKNSKSFPFAGSSEVSDAGWNINNTEGHPEPVASAKIRSNELGLWDMSGNVWEWCWDHFVPHRTAQNGILSNPAGPKQGDQRVIRGGSWSAPADRMRLARREGAEPEVPYSDQGFRLARTKQTEGL